ncbi:MAG: PD40 domain-containing protein [Gemmatimonadetes bacterium]|nr:PD40 domain-containing protein [Gemmatimonadota bacterium]
MVNADGTGVTRLTTHPGRDVSPSWSPDGKWIAYHRDDGTGTSPDLYIIAADGSGAPIRVTADPAFDGFVDWGRRIR